MKMLPLKQKWMPLVAAAAWLGAVTGAFLSFPVRLSIESDDGLLISGFAQFFVAALFGILTMVTASRSNADQTQGLVLWSIVLFVSFGILFLAYLYLSSQWTCRFAGQYDLVIGSEMSADAQAYLRRNPHFSHCNALIAEYGGDTGKVYDATQLLVRFIALAITYTLLWVLAAALVFFIARGLTIADQPKKP